MRGLFDILFLLVRQRRLRAASRRFAPAFAILIPFLVSCCATAPVEEARAFADAVKAVKSASDLIWDELNVAERNQRLKLINRTPGSQTTFSTGDAYYFATIAEAPATTKFRKGFAVIQDYSTILVSLVEGQNVDSTRGQLEAFASTLGAVAQLPEIGEAVKLLAPFINQAILAYDIREARRLVVAGSPHISLLIQKLGAAAPEIFSTLISDLQASIVVDPATGKKINAYRVTVSNYVVLLDRLQSSFDVLLPAFDRASNPATLAALVRATANLNADADAVRKILVLARR